MTDGVTLPGALTPGVDWNTTLQNIVAYGAGRYFDSEAVNKIYKSNPTPMNMDDFGNFFTAGTKSTNGSAVTTQPLGVPLIVWLLGGGILAFVLLKD